jgi:hypothetical protein
VVPPGSSLKNLRKYSTGVYTHLWNFNVNLLAWDDRFYIVEGPKNTAKYFTNLAVVGLQKRALSFPCFGFARVG